MNRVFKTVLSKKLYFHTSKIFYKMPKIRVTKRFHFEMAHTLYEYDGLCQNIHGHSYNLEVTLIGNPRKEPNHPKDGMVMDFSELKRIVKKEIVDRFDHALMVNNLVPESQLDLLRKTTDRIIIVEFQPTSENIAAYIAEILQQHLPAGVSLFSIRLFETVTAFAEWFASDNQ
jgi:6-pyruvoyltetrahydropterin/6-carboxytetrahydropterin synthase